MPKRDEKQNGRTFKAEMKMSGETAVIEVSGCIGWDTDAMDFCKLVDEAKESGASKVELHINSLGGYCYDGLAMGDKLASCGLETHGIVYGTAQSMASYLLECCDVREAHANATLMFHQPSAGICGTVDELLAEAQYLVGMRDKMFETMGKRCGMSGAELSAEHMTMKLYTAEQAKEKGFLDVITGEKTEEPAESAGGMPSLPGRAELRAYGEHGVFDLAMLAEGAAEDAPAEDAPAEDAPAEEKTDLPEEKPAPAPEPPPAPPAEPEPASAPSEAGMSKEQVEKMIAAAVAEAEGRTEARVLASLGADAGKLPRASVASAERREAEYTNEQLDAMSFTQRADILARNPRLAQRYAAGE